MGLDMFLNKRTYLYGADVDVTISGHTRLSGMNVGDKFKLDNVSYISESVGYWRKANHIHNWFVENVQDGRDDCAEYFVSADMLGVLLDACNEVLNKCKIVNGNFANPDVARSSLPRCQGFFFGDNEYDEDYLSDIRDTVEILNRALKNKENCEYYYSSSW